VRGGKYSDYMKPCARNKKLLVWMASGALHDGEAKRLKDHFQTCPGCLEYWQEMSHMTKQLDGCGKSIPPVAPPLDFHRKLTARLAHERKSTVWDEMALGWRWIWSQSAGVKLSVAAVLALCALFLLRRGPNRALGPTETPILVHEGFPAEKSTPLPSVAVYRRAADTSLDTLDEVLNRQGRRGLPAAEAYRVASGLRLEELP